MVMSKTSGLASLFPGKGGKKVLPLKDTRHRIGPGHPLYDPMPVKPPHIFVPPTTQVITPGAQTLDPTIPSSTQVTTPGAQTGTAGVSIGVEQPPTATPIDDTPTVPGPGVSIKAKVRKLQMQKKRLMKQIAQIDLQIRSLLGGMGTPIRPPDPPWAPIGPGGGQQPPTIGPGLPVPIGPGTPIPPPPRPPPPWGG